VLPGFLLHLNAMVNCAHGGIATPMTTIPNVLVMGQPITVMTVPYGIVGCALPPPIAANGPCVTAMWVSAALCVSSYGNPVLLQDSQAICAPSGTPLLISTTQMCVAGM
jgi:hypothetical protein